MLHVMLRIGAKDKLVGLMNAEKGRSYSRMANVKSVQNITKLLKIKNNARFQNATIEKSFF